ncbi:hypothetical protein [Variovorax ginsengisoli]|uniref:Uncharacterized protein n=1 Tax=Variovorax ginsengisoli TaxID=363844 RepID=A0ABT8SFG6_9BURK|nr:hypothetical protein [Variovorax ginsengisoli]MDN8618501.1 hypothetical protein [Variovorax ginsengisoli]MDO1537671.1 hypothetical protein [Variovorax ginsengisoli]
MQRADSLEEAVTHHRGAVQGVTAAICTVKLKDALGQVNAQNVDVHDKPPMQERLTDRPVCYRGGAGSITVERYGLIESLCWRGFQVGPFSLVVCSRTATPPLPCPADEVDAGICAAERRKVLKNAYEDFMAAQT